MGWGESRNGEQEDGNGSKDTKPEEVEVGLRREAEASSS